jgi:lipopolysaccharide/colanic/teichoic acid biosynthesis glycosyltransferase
LATRTERRTPELKEGAAREGGEPPVNRPRWVRPAPDGRETITPMGYHWYLPCKTVVDRVLALVLLVPAAPLLALAALLVKLTSRGPAFYTQQRLGLNGKPFTIYKLRTMIHKAESLTGPRWSLPGDPRITRMGVLLRVTHLDELPQLLNVLRGEMSLIGPRPERPEFLPELERALPAYRKRLAVRPGVTGLAQVQLPPDSDVHSVRRKLAYDLFYVQRISPWLDVRLLCCTLFYAVGVPYSKLGRWFRIPRLEDVERAMQPHLVEGQAARPLRRSA